MKTFAELEAERPQDFQNPEKTPEQLVADEQCRQIQRNYEAKHTPIETDEDRANLDEYPQEEE